MAVALVLGLIAYSSTRSEPPSPNEPAIQGQSDEELRQDIYEAAVDACSAFPPQEGEDAIGAAEDYADDYQSQFEQAAFEGCLDGFREAGAIP